ESTCEDSVQRLIAGTCSGALIGSLCNLERGLRIALVDRDDHPGWAAQRGLAARRLPIRGPAVRLVVNPARVVIAPLHAQEVGEEQLRADKLAAVVAIAEALVDVDHLALQFLGVLVAALFLQRIDKEPERVGRIDMILADLAEAAEQCTTHVCLAL